MKQNPPCDAPSPLAGEGWGEGGFCASAIYAFGAAYGLLAMVTAFSSANQLSLPAVCFSLMIVFGSSVTLPALVS